MFSPIDSCITVTHARTFVRLDAVAYVKMGRQNPKLLIMHAVCEGFSPAGTFRLFRPRRCLNPCAKTPQRRAVCKSRDIRAFQPPAGQVPQSPEVVRLTAAGFRRRQVNEGYVPDLRHIISPANARAADVVPRGA